MILPLAACVALGSAFFLVRSRRAYLALAELRADLRAPRPDLAVVIPARDEAPHIARAVRSFPGLPVTVVDDHSSDATAEQARLAGARVLTAPPLPAGACGKPHACLAGARATSSEWILFVDADTWFDPVFAPSLVAEARRRGLEMASVFLRQHRATCFERILLPYAFALYFAGVPRLRPERALANGQCLLFRRAAYDRIGGHSAVLGSIIEDAGLARAADASGLRAALFRAESLGSVRMYDSLRAIWLGFRKNSFRFLAADPRSGAAVVAASILLASWAPVLAGLAAARQFTLAAVFSVLPSLFLFPWYRDWRASLASPAAIYLFQAIAIDAMVRTLARRTTLWKGRPV